MGADANASGPVREPDPPRRPDDGASADDERRLAAAARTLADGVEQHLASWVVDSVERIWCAWSPDTPPPTDAARRAGDAARDEVAPRVRALLETDIDDQRTTPLAVLRDAVDHPTRVLRRAGVPGVVRDAAAVRHFPEDDYDLAIASFGDLHPSLAEPGIVWGAAKAHVHLARRRAEGR